MGESLPSFLDRIQQLSLSEEGATEPVESEGSEETEEASQLLVLDPNHVRTSPPGLCREGGLRDLPSPARGEGGSWVGREGES